MGSMGSESSSPTVKEVREHKCWQELEPHIVKWFWIYHTENPHVFDFFRKFAHEMRNAGRRCYSARTIVERVRWHVDLTTRNDPFKINDHAVPCYSRLLSILDPSFESFFRFRAHQDERSD